MLNVMLNKICLNQTFIYLDYQAECRGGGRGGGRGGRYRGVTGGSSGYVLDLLMPNSLLKR
jgi:hypothetical protein